MTIYRCDACSARDGIERSPCIFIDVTSEGNGPEMCKRPTPHSYTLSTKWVRISELPDEIIEELKL